MQRTEDVGSRSVKAAIRRGSDLSGVVAISEAIRDKARDIGWRRSVSDSIAVETGGTGWSWVATVVEDERERVKVGCMKTKHQGMIYMYRHLVGVHGITGRCSTATA